MAVLSYLDFFSTGVQVRMDFQFVYICYWSETVMFSSCYILTCSQKVLAEVEAYYLCVVSHFAGTVLCDDYICHE